MSEWMEQRARLEAKAGAPGWNGVVVVSAADLRAAITLADALLVVARAADAYALAKCASYPQVAKIGKLRERWDALVRALEDDRVIDVIAKAEEDRT